MRSGALDVDAEQVARQVVAVLMGLEMRWLMDLAAFDDIDPVDDYASGLSETLTT